VELLEMMLTDHADVDVASVVRETLGGIAPRSAAKALLRLPRFLDLMQAAGVDPTDELCSALVAELRAVCALDTVIA
jgi:hypothetical protein